MAGAAADILQAVRAGDSARAASLAATLLSDVAGQPMGEVSINADRYSLNSVNGFARRADGTRLFFKFHHEEGEEHGVDEYYNARVLAEAGYPVITPLFQCTEPGRQVLVYPFIDFPRMSDLCSAVERGAPQVPAARLIAAQQRADRLFSDIAVASLRWSDLQGEQSPAIHQLFTHRLRDGPDDATATGGRVRRFYRGRQVSWPGLTAPFDDIRDLPWRINGRDHAVSLREGFARCRDLVSPGACHPGPVVTAHGDAHNANVFLATGGGAGQGDDLRLFDPAFASTHVPALLAEVKATFHNVFAHPFWLYEPHLAADAFTARATLCDGRIEVETDFSIGALRRAFLISKAEGFWVPLLRALAARGWLVADWEARVRAALFACPTLVMGLLPGPGSPHDPTSSLIGFAQAIAVLQAPEGGAKDEVTAFFDILRAGLGGPP